MPFLCSKPLNPFPSYSRYSLNNPNFLQVPTQSQQAPWCGIFWLSLYLVLLQPPCIIVKVFCIDRTANTLARSTKNIMDSGSLNLWFFLYETHSLQLVSRPTLLVFFNPLLKSLIEMQILFTVHKIIFINNDQPCQSHISTGNSISTRTTTTTPTTPFHPYSALLVSAYLHLIFSLIWWSPSILGV